MNSGGDTISNVVEWRDKAEELSKAWADCYCQDGIPEKEFVFSSFLYLTFFPCDFGMQNICYDCGNSSSNKIRKPNEIVIFDNNIGKNGVETVIKESDCDTNKKITCSVMGGVAFSFFHSVIIAYGQMLIFGV